MWVPPLQTDTAEQQLSLLPHCTYNVTILWGPVLSSDEALYAGTGPKGTVPSLSCFVRCFVTSTRNVANSVTEHLGWLTAQNVPRYLPCTVWWQI